MARAAHHIGMPLSKYYLDYPVLCDGNLAVLNDFQLDLVPAISDSYREAADIRLDVEFPDDDLPLIHNPLVVDLDDLSHTYFPVKDLGARMTDRLEGIRAMREQLGDHIPVMGWVEGAFAEATDLHGITNITVDLGEQPDRLKEFLEK